MKPATPDEIMTVAAARALRDRQLCFVGIGLPSAAANLARRLHAPGLVLVYESGTIGSKPRVLPLSIGDGELAETADAVVSVPEIFFYWLQAGRIDVGFLGGAQIDRFGNLNTTVIGPYHAPVVRLPGAGGAPEIAAHARETLVVMRHRRRSFVERLDFVTTPGHLEGGDARPRAGMPGAGPARVITDLGVLEPDPRTRELALEAVHPGVAPEEVLEATGWPLRVASEVATTEAPTPAELETLLTRAHLAGREVVFLDRHRAPEPGAGRVPPHRIDYQANMAALASVGVTGVLASNAVGSLRREWAPGTLVLPDQILDRTSGRPLTFFDHRPVHVDFTEPYCSRLRKLLRKTALDMGIELADGGTYLCTNGPRFETAAEIRAYGSLGADLVGMTAMPEAVLAREAGISYAAVTVVTNPAAGTAAGALTEAEVLDAMSGAMPRLARLFHEAAGRYRDDPSTPARRATAEFGSPDVT